MLRSTQTNKWRTHIVPRGIKTGLKVMCLLFLTGLLLIVGNSSFRQEEIFDNLDLEIQSQDTSLSQMMQDTARSVMMQDTSHSQMMQDTSHSQMMQDTSHSQMMQDTSLSQLMLDTSRSRMKERIERVHRICAKYNLYGNSSLNKGANEKQGVNNTEFLLDRDRHLGFCKVPKVASTSWVESLLKMLATKDQLAQIDRIGFEHRLLKEIMPHVTPQDDLSQVVSFMTVRHPFDRVISAYCDRMHRLNESEMYDGPIRRFKKKHNLPIIKKYRKVVPENKAYVDVPTFAEFVDYLIDEPTEEYNIHWKTVYSICMPCHINYTFIMKLETLAADTQLLVERTGLPELLPNKTHETPYSHQPTVVEGLVQETELKKSLLTQIPKSKLLKLYEKYKFDFEMFGYDFEM